MGFLLLGREVRLLLPRELELKVVNLPVETGSLVPGVLRKLSAVVFEFLPLRPLPVGFRLGLLELCNISCQNPENARKKCVSPHFCVLPPKPV